MYMSQFICVCVYVRSVSEYELAYMCNVSMCRIVSEYELVFIGNRKTTLGCEQSLSFVGWFSLIFFSLFPKVEMKGSELTMWLLLCLLMYQNDMIG